MNSIGLSIAVLVSRLPPANALLRLALGHRTGRSNKIASVLVRPNIGHELGRVNGCTENNALALLWPYCLQERTCREAAGDSLDNANEISLALVESCGSVNRRKRRIANDNLICIKVGLGELQHGGCAGIVVVLVACSVVLGLVLVALRKRQLAEMPVLTQHKFCILQPEFGL